MVDYVVYSDTDSAYVKIGAVLCNLFGEKWLNASDDIKIQCIRMLSNDISNKLNDRSYRETQCKHYNCLEEDFRIKFKQEVIAKSALFVAKKKYSIWCVDEEGIPTDKLKTTGLEIVRSETPAAVKPKLKHVMEMILKGASDDELSNQIHNYKSELFNVIPEEIAVNVGISHIDKFVTGESTAKGTPWHVKGALNYRKMLNELGLVGKYDEINEGNKAKIVYVKKNNWSIDSIAFHRWPEEFKGVLEVDYLKMVDKYFIGKIEILLEPINKIHLLQYESKKVLDAFF